MYTAFSFLIISILFLIIFNLYLNGMNWILAFGILKTKEIRCISPYSVQMRENTDQKTSNMDTFHTVIFFNSQDQLPILFITVIILKELNLLRDFDLI